MELLLFDEAASALDMGTEVIVAEWIKHLHGKKAIKICDVVYRVEEDGIWPEIED